MTTEMLSVSGEASGSTAACTVARRACQPPLSTLTALHEDAEPCGSRAAIAGGVAFLEAGEREWSNVDLVAWLDEHLVRPGYMLRPHTIRERETPPVDLQADSVCADVSALVQRSTQRVLRALRGIVPPSSDDRFVNGAIYSGRVRRSTVEGAASWVASPRVDDFLSEMVLSLFAADVLADGDYYASHMCLCFACGRLTFQRHPSRRTACEAHRGR